MRAMKNYAGHRLSPWLSHLMVSRQETSRPLLTSGEVMQLSPNDAIVMVSGVHPVRARKVAAAGRDPQAVKILPGIQPFVGRTEEEAKAKHRALLELIHPDAGLGHLSTLIGVDMSGYPLDGPVPELPVTESHRCRQKLLLDLARRENLTVRQLYGHVCNGAGHHTAVGTPVQIADRLEHWFDNGAADGFNILPGGLEDFVDLVVPELQRRGLFRTAYEGTTLRDHLGLSRPALKTTKASRVPPYGVLIHPQPGHSGVRPRSSRVVIFGRKCRLFLSTVLSCHLFVKL
jgi:hypothetical protein